jgi:hypothetical protein
LLSALLASPEGKTDQPRLANTIPAIAVFALRHPCNVMTAPLALVLSARLQYIHMNITNGL